MSITEKKSKFSASRTMASIWGILAALGGLTHGIGEILQGSVAPESIVINSWAEGPIATNLGGEPGMTIIPNFLITGILCILVAIVIIIWAIWFVDRKHGGQIMILLFGALLLFGGGFAPPIMGMLAGWAGTGIHSPLTFWRTRFSPDTQHRLSRAWIWLFVISLFNMLILVVGSVMGVYLFNVNNADFFSNLFLLTFALMPVTVVTGFVYDVYHKEPILAAKI